jgi:hypothetical protein
MMAEGRLPALDRIRKRSATFLLDHGGAERTGLAWEHISTGLSPDDAKHWSAVHFDRRDYHVRQMPTRTTPFPAALKSRCVVFDPPYFDLDRAPDVRGVTNWGAHDPGVTGRSRPATIGDELVDRFGAYPGQDWIYGFTWPWPERTKRMADDLERAVDVRADAAEWLLAERLPDWGLALVAVAEYHSAIEDFWHGVDATHPLHGIRSAAPAKEGLERVFEAGDRMIGRLTDRFPEAALAIFAMHGMGPNTADLPAMILLPELLYRYNFGKSCLNAGKWETTEDGVPIITSDKGWGSEVSRTLPRSMRFNETNRNLFVRIARRVFPRKPDPFSIEWMPTTRYGRYWPQMRAFALPSYYDGQIRINLNGREGRGVVERRDYEALCDALESLLRECCDPISGEPVVTEIIRAENPDKLGPHEADLMVLWRGAPLGIAHPTLGTIGPLPPRRTGGHTGRSGVAWFSGPSIQPGHYGMRSSFDVVPTVIEMLGEKKPVRLSGESLLPRMKAAA